MPTHRQTVLAMRPGFIKAVLTVLIGVFGALLPVSLCFGLRYGMWWLTAMAFFIQAVGLYMLVRIYRRNQQYMKATSAQTSQISHRRQPLRD
jgi:hypothetical protein